MQHWVIQPADVVHLGSRPEIAAYKKAAATCRYAIFKTKNAHEKRDAYPDLNGTMRNFEIVLGAAQSFPMLVPKVNRIASEYKAAPSLKGIASLLPPFHPATIPH